MSAPGDPGRRLVRDRVLIHDQRPPTLPREATNLEQATQRFLSPWKPAATSSISEGWILGRPAVKRAIHRGSGWRAVPTDTFDLASGW